MVTTATVDYEHLENCVDFAAKRYRAGQRPAFLEKASGVPIFCALLKTSSSRSRI
jgi:hypothetical protein